MATDLKVYEPIEIPFTSGKGNAKHIDKPEKKEFLSRLNQAGLSNKQGCYVFALRAGKGFCPWYVGKATVSMEQECMGNAIQHYNAVLFKGIKGTPVMFVVALDGNKSKVPRKTCDDIETFLIQTALFENPDLRNIQKTKVPEWSIDGVIRANRGKPTSIAQVFKKMMGLDLKKPSGGSPKKVFPSVKADAKIEPSRAADNVPEEKARQEPASPTAFPMPDCVPFRPSSGYAKIFAILYDRREKGISKTDLVDCYKQWSAKDGKRADYAVDVVLSAKEDGSSHPNISKAAQRYWVVNTKGSYILHLRQEAEGEPRTEPEAARVPQARAVPAMAQCSRHQDGCGELACLNDSSSTR